MHCGSRKPFRLGCDVVSRQNFGIGPLLDKLFELMVRVRVLRRPVQMLGVTVALVLAVFLATAVDPVVFALTVFELSVLKGVLIINFLFLGRRQQLNLALKHDLVRGAVDSARLLYRQQEQDNDDAEAATDHSRITPSDLLVDDAGQVCSADTKRDRGDKDGVGTRTLVVSKQILDEADTRGHMNRADDGKKYSQCQNLPELRDQRDHTTDGVPEQCTCDEEVLTIYLVHEVAHEKASYRVRHSDSGSSHQRILLIVQSQVCAKAREFIVAFVDVDENLGD